jgi:hypothetical protein
MLEAEDNRAMLEFCNDIHSWQSESAFDKWILDSFDIKVLALVPGTQRPIFARGPMLEYKF